MSTTRVPIMILVVALGGLTAGWGSAASPAVEFWLTVTTKESQRGGFAVTSSYRGGEKILEKMTPKKEGQNRVFSVYLQGSVVPASSAGPGGTEFWEAGPERKTIKPEYVIKRAGDKTARIRRITLYSPDDKRAFDGFWLKDNELVPWSAEELAGWRKLRDAKPPGQKENQEEN